MSLYDPDEPRSSVSYFRTGCLGSVRVQDWSDGRVGWNPFGNCPGIPTLGLGGYGLKKIDPAPNVPRLRRNARGLQTFHALTDKDIALIL
jgi:hypothetical protein